MNAISNITAAEQSSDILGRHHLSPAQQKAFDELAELIAVAPVVALDAAAGLGKSTILKALANTYGGEIVSWHDIVCQVALRSPEAADDSIIIAIEGALERSDLVLLDGLEVITLYKGFFTPCYFMLRAITTKAAELNKRLIIAGNQAFTGAPTNRSYGADLFGRSPSEFLKVPIDAFEASDYRAFLVNSLGEQKTANIDFDQLYRHASMLSGHDLRTLAGLLVDMDKPTTEDAVARLEDVVIECNTNIEEVEELTFADLPGTEEIAAKLETHIILPLTNKKLARDLGIKPKRGVLLYGPPGTGKTSIGRALAHRMKGRLHLIDGSFITEPPITFYNKVRTIVQEAKDNAPSVLFVDDADVLFGIEHISGLSRFLLSLLDGVESESAGNVCVMMTAMNVSKVPSAIMRSGRVELWLETKAPDVETRAAIIKKWLGNDLPGSDKIDFMAVAAEAKDFTPADLRRITGDARTFHGADVIAQRKQSTAQQYLTRAVEELIATRTRMADNLRDESLRIGTVSYKAKYGEGIGGVVEVCTHCAVKGW